MLNTSVHQTHHTRRHWLNHYHSAAQLEDLFTDERPALETQSQGNRELIDFRKAFVEVRCQKMGTFLKTIRNPVFCGEILIKEREISSAGKWNWAPEMRGKRTHFNSPWAVMTRTPGCRGKWRWGRSWVMWCVVKRWERWGGGVIHVETLKDFSILCLFP